ncbi:hypothetical protein THICB1_30040 [Thiomonas arsenitoxydans]|uniref:Transposase n=1 Tax=Thiomonas arsenitoxydans (strain DSM 22701 / CIP 110005 / 3As) TaxID=426114 RepID=A0ABM9T534_THIA3|nr:transposase [Thiomonas arsenitoxydans]CQR33117.1 hypothetical protein THICB1_30040 [Thiomonas arsenitoxydans]CQR33739.1 hypothetical protein ACO7_360090 [Thiomonas arsenitoxydans]CQR34031.1 hypothetical protein ACO3_380090 [Thiomonas arsenitoxydans]CQR39595.1 hypothetical protein THICB6_80040 [Thiomonas arsenitoxydans]
MSRFVCVDRDTAYLLPPSVDEWLPSDHLARFVVEVIDRLDLDDLVKQYAGRGSAAHHPAVLLGLLIYGYANGVHSSRKIERATYDSVAFRFVAANTHPDHDTLAAFRRRFLKEIEALFVQVLVLAREMKLLKLGHIALDGTKIRANASKHKALSWGHANKIEAQLRQEVQDLLARAEKDDRSSAPDGMDVPAEIARREDRLRAIAQAKAQINAPRTAEPVASMAHRLCTQAGRALYKLRKQTVEPVFGIIKHVMGWRQMSMRGLHKAQGEWNLVTLAWNIKRMHVLRAG